MPVTWVAEVLIPRVANGVLRHAWKDSRGCLSGAI
jgi:hypothetical protein